jgi:hypothetical protein
MNKTRADAVKIQAVLAPSNFGVSAAKEGKMPLIKRAKAEGKTVINRTSVMAASLAVFSCFADQSFQLASLDKKTAVAAM